MRRTRAESLHRWKTNECVTNVYYDERIKAPYKLIIYVWHQEQFLLIINTIDPVPRNGAGGHGLAQN